MLLDMPPKSLVDVTVGGAFPYEGRIFPAALVFVNEEWNFWVIPAHPSTEAAFHIPVKDIRVWAPAGHL